MKIFKIIKCLFLIVFIFLCVINISLLVSLKLLGNDYPNILGFTYFEVETGSMRDTINEGDIIIVKLNSDISVGDIVTYKSDNSFITHRIISIYQDEVITKGDANNTNDTPINKTQIIGKVVLIIPELGIVLRVITDKSTIILAFLFIIIISYMETLVRRREYVKK